MLKETRISLLRRWNGGGVMGNGKNKEIYAFSYICHQTNSTLGRYHGVEHVCCDVCNGGTNLRRVPQNIGKYIIFGSDHDNKTKMS